MRSIERCSPGLRVLTEPNLVAGSLEACHRILGPVRDTATFADNEYLHRMSSRETAREDIRIR